MEFTDLIHLPDSLKQRISENIACVIDRGAFIMGQEVALLEEKLAEYTGVKHVITCDNGTNAIALALKAIGVGCGDCVFVPAFTFFGTAEAVTITGATPVFVDSEPDTFNMCPLSLERTIQSLPEDMTPKAVVPVDLYGLPANYIEIGRICDKYQLSIIEDAAQSFGGMIGNKKCCSFGELATTSFFPTKPLGCFGDGGAVFTNNDEWADILRSIRQHGKGNHKYIHVRVGVNSRLDTLQAAVLLARMDTLEQEITRRASIAKKYDSVLSGSRICIPLVPEGYTSAWAQYTVLTESKAYRDLLANELKAYDVPTMIHYPIPLHLQPVYAYLGHQKGDFPIAEDLSERVISLPISGFMQQADVDSVCRRLYNFVNINPS